MGGREGSMSCWLTLMAPNARQQAAFQDPEGPAPPQGCGEAGPAQNGAGCVQPVAIGCLRRVVCLETPQLR